MDHMGIKTKQCGSKEIDSRLKEQFIGGINDNDIIHKMIKELTTVIETNEITSEQGLCLGRRV